MQLDFLLIENLAYVSEESLPVSGDYLKNCLIVYRIRMKLNVSWDREIFSLSGYPLKVDMFFNFLMQQIITQRVTDMVDPIGIIDRLTVLLKHLKNIESIECIIMVRCHNPGVKDT